MTVEEKTQAQDLLTQMIAADFSRDSMEIRLDEVERSALQLDDSARKRSLLDIAGEIRRLMAKESKLAAAGILAGRNRKPYSQL